MFNILDSISLSSIRSTRIYINVAHDAVNLFRVNLFRERGIVFMTNIFCPIVCNLRELYWRIFTKLYCRNRNEGPEMNEGQSILDDRNQEFGHDMNITFLLKLLSLFWKFSLMFRNYCNKSIGVDFIYLFNVFQVCVDFGLLC